ncbi:hypothetical protein SAMN05444156_1196 [Verrucomicrobium sp. GAS474]|nr:hypothetical protein SAMN05444156_1196 [Verrucomicrobium sp. GAS474]
MVTRFFRGCRDRGGGGVRGGVGGEGDDGVAFEGGAAFVDAGGDLGFFGEGAAEHFDAGVEVVEVVEGPGFGGAGGDGGAVFALAVVGGDEVEEVEADGFGGGLVAGGGGEFEFGVVLEGAPEVVGEFDADGDVAHEFSDEGVGHEEALGLVVVFPEFAAVVEEDAEDDEVPVEVGVDGAEGLGAADHLGDVFDEAAAAGVVVVAGGGGAAEFFAVEGEEGLAEEAEAGVGEGVDGGGDVVEFAVEEGLAFGGAGEEGVDFLGGEGAELGAVEVEAVLVAVVVGFEGDEGAGAVAEGFGVGGAVGPEFDFFVAGAVADLEVEVGFAGFGFAGVEGGDLDGDFSVPAALAVVGLVGEVGEEVAEGHGGRVGQWGGGVQAGETGPIRPDSYWEIKPLRSRPLRALRPHGVGPPRRGAAGRGPSGPPLPARRERGKR